MAYPKLTDEDIKNFKIVDGYKLHNNCYCLIIELPSNRNYPSDISERDKRYLTGIIWTFPFKYQLELLRLVIDNKVRDHARQEYIEMVEELLNKLKPQKDSKTNVGLADFMPPRTTQNE